MANAKSTVLLMAALAMALSACASKDGGMMNLRSSTSGPDEFSILPSKALVLPKSYAELPNPTPGGANLADPTPNADAVKALGGNPKYLVTDGIPAGDGGIVQVASRYGVQDGIRTTLAGEDAEFRKKNRGKILERLFGVTVYFSAYEKQELNSEAELKRLRRAGVRTPAAPPATVN